MCPVWTAHRGDLCRRSFGSIAVELVLSIPCATSRAVKHGPAGCPLCASVFRGHPLSVHAVAAEYEEEGHEDGDEGDARDHDSGYGAVAEGVTSA